MCTEMATQMQLEVILAGKRESRRQSSGEAHQKKGDRDLEREIKNIGDIFLLGEQHENFVAVVRK